VLVSPSGEAVEPLFVLFTTSAAVLPPVTVTVAVPDLLASAVEVALTVSDARVSVAATVSKPLVLLIVVPEFLPVSTIDHVTVCAGLLVPATVALNCCVPPLATLGVAGLTVTPVTVGAGAVTVTVAVPDLEVSAVEVALTVKVVAVSPAATVKVPLVILVPVIPPVTDHVTVVAGLFVPCTVAVNACVPPLITFAVEGFTVTPVTVGGGVVTVTVAEPNLVVSTVEVALTVSVVRVSAAATVSKPFALIVVSEFLPVSTIDHVTDVAGLLVPVTEALNCRVAPLSTLALAGLTVTLETVGVGASAARTAIVASLVTLPEYPVWVTVTFIYLPASPVTGI